MKVGDESTYRYHDSCLSAGLTIKKTKKQQDIGHVDFVINGETVDLKGIKNFKRVIGRCFLMLKILIYIT